ncbi:DUF1800 domain-containing protein [Rhodoblastus sp.]|uniref:DUF1800 domain-containing protein n=1 Tax=Rhodoblastus sp. TaxID=1962975 RepID=UPI003F98E160
MAVRDERQGFIALTRFGFGACGDGDLAAASLDPRGFLHAELESPGAALLAGPGLPSGDAALQTFFAEEDAKKAEREKLAQNLAMENDIAAQKTMPEAVAPPSANPPGAMAAKPPKPPSADHMFFRADARARINRAFIARVGLVERLVAFWSNHFAISVAKGGPTRAAAGAFEREAIRPNVLGRFSDMLLAVESHPAMLFYLDNQQSIGPDSPAGQKQHRGRNENLGREILELHTLGVNGGYSQADVIALSNMLTGWRFVGREGKLGTPGSFVFQPHIHEPGAQKLLGADYLQAGQDQAQAALLALARRPETARHLATKLTKHFIADAPPQALVDRLAQVFVKTDGDLRAVSLALVDSPEAFAAPPTKMRTPWEYCLASARLFGRAPDDPGPVLSSLAMLGQPLWRPPGPNGFPDDSAAWTSPEGMKLRLDLASQWANRLRDPPDPRELLDAAFGAGASDETRKTVARAETRAQGLALLLMAPEAQRR